MCTPGDNGPVGVKDQVPDGDTVGPCAPVIACVPSNSVTTASGSPEPEILGRGSLEVASLIPFPPGEPGEVIRGAAGATVSMVSVWTTEWCGGPGSTVTATEYDPSFKAMLTQLNRDLDTRVTHSGRLTSAALTRANTPVPTPTNAGVESFVYAAGAGEMTAGAMSAVVAADSVATA
ncbi:hypothetical protein GCM10027052_11030 [Parafrigoribacterium mesophilum]